MSNANKYIKINNDTITVKEYAGRRVLTINDIARIHRKPSDTIRNKLYRCKSTGMMIPGVDYLTITDIGTARKYSDGFPARLLLVTQSGYLKLSASCHDAFLQETRQQVLDSYFKKASDANSLQTPSHAGADAPCNPVMDNAAADKDGMGTCVLRPLEDGLVPVYETDKGEKVVYGTELHKVLGVKSKFADWVKNRLDDCDAVKNEDFDSFSKILENGGGRSIEYIIRLDTAKEMAMLERNDKGKQVRRYFIQVEKKYREIGMAVQKSEKQIMKGIRTYMRPMTEIFGGLLASVLEIQNDMSALKDMPQGKGRPGDGCCLMDAIGHDPRIRAVLEKLVDDSLIRYGLLTPDEAASYGRKTLSGS